MNEWFIDFVWDCYGVNRIRKGVRGNVGLKMNFPYGKLALKRPKSRGHFRFVWDIDPYARRSRH